MAQTLITAQDRDDINRKRLTEHWRAMPADRRQRIRNLDSYEKEPLASSGTIETLLAVVEGALRHHREMFAGLRSQLVDGHDCVYKAIEPAARWHPDGTPANREAELIEIIEGLDQRLIELQDTIAGGYVFSEQDWLDRRAEHVADRGDDDAPTPTTLRRKLFRARRGAN